MKILYFHQHFTTPQLGGATRSYEFAHYLIKRGHEVTVVCGGDASRFNLPATKRKNIYYGNLDGINVIQISLPYSNNDGLLKRTKVFLLFAFIGIKIALREEYDLLFATSTPLTAGIPGICAKLLRRKKFVFEVRDLWPDLPKALGMKNIFALWGMSLLERMSYYAADACIGLSPGICEGIVRRSKKNKKVCMIPNGCDLNIFTPGYRFNLRLEGVKLTDTVAVFTGAHGVANGLKAILDVAKVLIERGRDDIKLVFIGDGKEKPELEKIAKTNGLTNCLFFDPMPKTKLNKIISCVDIGVMVLANIPAFYYGTSPNKFFDYISSGLPIINNYPGWLADMIKENECGIVVDPDNPIAFADGLLLLADDSSFRKRCGNNARKLAEKSFNRAKLAEQFVNFLENV